MSKHEEQTIAEIVETLVRQVAAELFLALTEWEIEALSTHVVSRDLQKQAAERLRTGSAEVFDFRLKDHTIIRGRKMVEVLDEKGEMIAGIYRTEGGLKIVSRLLTADRVHFDPEGPPALIVALVGKTREAGGENGR